MNNYPNLSIQSQNRICYAIILINSAIGISIGYNLSGYVTFETFKLLNIIGLIYDFLGIIVLSEIVTQNQNVKKFIVYWVAGYVIWATAVIPVGAAIGAVIGYIFSLPSSGKVGNFFMVLWVWSIILLVSIEKTVLIPKHPSLQKVEVRKEMFGLLLLLTGIFVQIIAAIKDLNT